MKRSKSEVTIILVNNLGEANEKIAQNHAMMKFWFFKLAGDARKSLRRKSMEVVRKRQSRWSRMKKAIMNYGSRPKTEAGRQYTPSSTVSPPNEHPPVRKISSAIDMPLRSPNHGSLPQRNVSMQLLIPLDGRDPMSPRSSEFFNATTLRPDFALMLPQRSHSVNERQREKERVMQTNCDHDGSVIKTPVGDQKDTALKPTDRLSPDANVQIRKSGCTKARQFTRWSLAPDATKSSSLGDDCTARSDVDEATRKRNAAKNARTRSVDDVIHEKRKSSEYSKTKSNVGSGSEQDKSPVRESAFSRVKSLLVRKGSWKKRKQRLSTPDRDYVFEVTQSVSSKTISTWGDNKSHNATRSKDRDGAGHKQRAREDGHDGRSHKVKDSIVAKRGAVLYSYVTEIRIDDLVDI